MTSRRTLTRLLSTALRTAVLLGILLVVLLPVFWMISTSLKSPDKIFALPIEWIPIPPHWETYPQTITKLPFPRWFLNSVLAATTVTASSLFLAGLAAYGLAKYRFLGRDLLFIVILSTIMLPIEVILIPTFLIVKELGLLNTFPGLVAPALVDAFGIFLMRQFMLEIPDDYIAAARLDGASEFTIFLRIVVPLSLPAFATLGVFAFRENWDLFIWPLVAMSKEHLWTVPVGIARLESDQLSAQHEQMAVACLAMIPIMIVFFLMQKSFMRGIVLSGLKE